MSDIMTFVLRGPQAISKDMQAEDPNNPGEPKDDGIEYVDNETGILGPFTEACSEDLCYIAYMTDYDGQKIKAGMESAAKYNVLKNVGSFILNGYGDPTRLEKMATCLAPACAWHVSDNILIFSGWYNTDVSTAKKVEVTSVEFDEEAGTLTQLDSVAVNPINNLQDSPYQNYVNEARVCAQGGYLYRNDYHLMTVDASDPENMVWVDFVVGYAYYEMLSEFDSNGILYYVNQDDFYTFDYNNGSPVHTKWEDHSANVSYKYWMSYYPEQNLVYTQMIEGDYTSTTLNSPSLYDVSGDPASPVYLQDTDMPYQFEDRGHYSKPVLKRGPFGLFAWKNYDQLLEFYDDTNPYNIVFASRLTVSDMIPELEGDTVSISFLGGLYHVHNNRLVFILTHNTTNNVYVVLLDLTDIYNPVVAGIMPIEGDKQYYGYHHLAVNDTYVWMTTFIVDNTTDPYTYTYTLDIFKPEEATLTNVAPKVTCGDDFSLMLTEDGVVTGFGRNDSCEVNTYYNGYEYLPNVIYAYTHPPYINKATDLFTGGRSSLIINNMDCLYGMGDNSGEQINPYYESLVWMACSFSLASDIRHAAIGANHAMVVDNSGNVRGWGNNASYAIDPEGEQDYIQSDTIVSNGERVYVGEACTFVVTEDAALIGWGTNGVYRLINPESTDTYWTDTEYLLFLDVKKVVSKNNATLVLFNNGDVIGWGQNSYPIDGGTGYGRVKPGSTSATSFDTENIIVSDAIDIELGTYHALALLEDGSVVGWGSNENRQLVDSDTVQWVDTTHVIVENITDIACGEAFSAFVSEYGGVLYSGTNPYLDESLSYYDAGSPQYLETWNLEPVMLWRLNEPMVACGQHTLALTKRSSLIGFGPNETTKRECNPWMETNPVEYYHQAAWAVKFIAAGAEFSMAIRGDGSLVGWGYNAYKQVNPNSSVTPIIESTHDPVLYDVAYVACGGRCTIAIHTNGDVVGWGENGDGAVNPDSTTTPWTDQEHVICTDAVMADCSIYASTHTVCLKSNGDVVAWGSNDYGAVNPTMGSGIQNSSDTPIISGAKWVAAGTDYTMAILTNGDLVGWGNNDNRQCNPDSSNSVWDDPTHVILSNVKEVRCGRYHTICILENGEIRGWGNNQYRQANPDSGTNPWTDKTHVIAEDATTLSCGHYHTQVYSDVYHHLDYYGNENIDRGYIYGWGYNADGAAVMGYADYGTYYDGRIILDVSLHDAW